MPTLIGDSSCLIDLHKVDLLHAFFDLPHTIIIPQALLDDELIRLTDEEKRDFLDRGLQTRHLDADGLLHAQRYFHEYPALAWNDCLALRLAEETEAAILLTGDGTLRRIATDNEIEVHGVIWALDEFHRHALVEPARLIAAIQALLDDPLVFLPDGELRQRLRRLRR